MGLTQEQKKRIEEKRREAMAKLKSKQVSAATTVPVRAPATLAPPQAVKATPLLAPPPVQSSNIGVITDGQKATIEARRLEALARKGGLHPSPRKTAAYPITGPVTATSFYSKQPSAQPSLGSATNSYSNSSTPYSNIGTSYSTGALINRFSSKSYISESQGNTTVRSIENKLWKGEGSGTKYTAGKVVNANCTLVARNRFDVISGYHEHLIKVFKTLKTGSYNAKTKVWSFDLSEHDQLIQAAGPLKGEVELTPLPRWILDTFRKPRDYSPETVDLSRIEISILDSLMPFQREGIQYGISRAGRVLIADDMGLGKTVQALGMASYYRDEWPFLVVAPSSMRYAWESAILRWLPSLTEEDITTVASGKDFIGSSTAVIISYDLLSKKSAELQKKRFNLVIMDESHAIKNDKSVRTKAAEPLMSSSRFLILLTGTPALSRPMELYSQVSALLPSMFKYPSKFGFRYCNGQMKKIGTKEVYDFSGSSNMEELSLLLLERCMVRRLKSDVLQQLPAKQRCMIVLDPSSVDLSSKAMKEKEKAAHIKGVTGMEKRGLLLEWYSATAQAKLKAVKEYIRDLLSSDKKFLLFCHHHVMLAGLAELLDSTNTGYIQIDGGTPSELRNTYVDRFQTSPSCKVALLSITAANSGLTLTSAHLVVFAEIYWNPGILTQAEDRVHRIGQMDSVTIQYLVARGTADDELWPMIQKKLDVLNKAGLTKDNFQDSESTIMVNKAQKTMEDYFSTDGSLTAEEVEQFDDDWDGALEEMKTSPSKKPRLE